MEDKKLEVEKSRKPKIRFDGFYDNWEQCKLENLLIQRIQHQKITENSPLLAFSYAEGVINPEDKKSNKRDFLMTDKNNKIFSYTEVDDIIYNPANVIHGAIHRNTLQNGVVSPIYKIFKCNTNTNSKFIGQRLHTDMFIKETTQYIEGTVIKLRTLAPENFLNMQIELPKNLEEQDKIGTYFTHLDHLITLHQQKYESLIEVKKTLLNKLFPIDGESIPTVRFKGFEGEWGECKLDDIAKIIMGQSPDGKTYSDKPSKYILVQGNADLENGWIKPKIWTTQLTKKATKGDLILSVRAPAGAVGKTEYDVVIGRGVAAIKGNEFVFQNLVKMNIEGYWKSVSCGSTFDSLTSENIKSSIILVPFEKEQEKIGQIFKNIDTLIDLHKRKYEKLVQIKKSMLGKMFVEE